MGLRAVCNVDRKLSIGDAVCFLAGDIIALASACFVCTCTIEFVFLAHEVALHSCFGWRCQFGGRMCHGGG